MLAEKISAVQKYLTEQGADWLALISLGHEVNDSILKYFLTIEPEHAALLIPQAGQPILFLTPFEVPEALAHYPELNVRPLQSPFSELMVATLLPASKVLIRENIFPISLYRALSGKLNFSAAENLEKVVAIKNPAEVAAMRVVTAKTDELFTALLANWSQFKTELDAAQFIKKFTLLNNCASSFPSIIATGANAAEPHHQTNSAKLVPGFCVIDIGLQIDGYCSDLSRTLYLGEPTVEECELYEKVLASQTAAIQAVKPLAKASEIDAVCRAVLGSWSEYFIHGLGHGVGTAVHEWPAISSSSQAILAPGMIITIEPGIYQSGKFGIRIEDDILVTKNGAEVLNAAPKNLIVLPVK